MFAVLGDIEFELITYWDGFEAQFGVDYAEHALIQGKPRLQFIGEKLDEISISLVFNWLYCTPETELARLRNLMHTHNAQALVFGNGDYRGWFVVTDVQATSEQTDRSGNVLALNAQVTLREYVGDPKKPLTAPAIAQTVPNTKAVAKSTAAAPSGMASMVRSAVGYARNAQSALQTATSTVRLVQKMATNPTVALSRVPGLMTQLGGVATPLTNAIPALSSVTSAFPDAARAVRSSSQALSFVNNARSSLLGVGSGNIEAAMNEVSTQLGAATSMMSQSSPAVSKMAAAISTRRI
ncbi:phage tail protein [Prodigiosinella aquatilis]|nr:phage tail protein [Prodigiosinella sp. LS101]WJV52746.1 phage tail protein [Prodigiosinella sp. LS101]WJV57101.1 phage tail protein [Pectobacteriaceae bacterium C111]